MPLHLDPDTEARIQHEIDSGRFHSPDELLNRALDLLGVEPQWTEEDKQELEAKLAEAEAQFERGEGIPGDQVRARLAELRAARLAEAS